jgi:hypothetical protein
MPAKKYLLYIHHPQFADEAKKSELVNELLEQHYTRLPATLSGVTENTVDFQTLPPIPPRAKTVVIRAKGTPAQIEDALESAQKSTSLPLCKNLHPAVREGKCVAKGCKYSVYAK